MLRGLGPWHIPVLPGLPRSGTETSPRRLRHIADPGRGTVPVLPGLPHSGTKTSFPVVFGITRTRAGTQSPSCPRHPVPCGSSRFRSFRHWPERHKFFPASSMKNVESPRKPVQSYRKSTNFNCLSENWSDVLICAAVSCIIQTKRGLRAFLARAASKQIQE